MPFTLPVHHNITGYLEAVAHLVCQSNTSYKLH